MGWSAVYDYGTSDHTHLLSSLTQLIFVMSNPAHFISRIITTSDFWSWNKIFTFTMLVLRAVELSTKKVVGVLCPYFKKPWDGLQYLIVVFPDQTHFFKH